MLCDIVIYYKHDNKNETFRYLIANRSSQETLFDKIDISPYILLQAPGLVHCTLG